MISMKTTFVAYLVAALAPTVLHASGLAPSCMYEFMCATDVDPEPGFSGNEDDCQAACEASPACTFWTYTKFHNEPKCFLLEHCDVHNAMCKVNDPTAPVICASGPNICPEESFCTKLTYPSDPTSDTKLCQCWDEPAPYSNNIPSSTLCSISCPTWKDAATGDAYPELVTATCIITDTWTTSHEVNDADGKIIKPDQNPSPECKCSTIVIPANVLESGENGGGAELYLDNVKVDPTAEITITSGQRGVLLCDRYPILNFSCLGGRWSDGVVDCRDIYCYVKPDEAKCGMTTTPAQTTTTAPP